MKRSLLTLMIVTGLARGQAPPVGSVAENVPFLLNQDGVLAVSDLDEYEGSILVLALVTPWCPICQTYGTNAARGMLDHFNSASRGELAGMNDEGVPIRSLMISTEPQVGWDLTNSSYAANNGYEDWGVDTDETRAVSSARVVLGYFRDGVAEPSTLGADRRRIVVLNLVNGSSSHQFREILLNQGSYTSSDNTASRAAINSVMPAPDVLGYADWASGFEFPPGRSGPDDDADLDGSANAWEYFHGTNPVVAGSRPASPRLAVSGGVANLMFTRARGIGGFALSYQRSTDLGEWLEVPAEDLEIMSTEMEGGLEEWMVAFPPSGNPSNFYRMEILTAPTGE